MKFFVSLEIVRSRTIYGLIEQFTYKFYIKHHSKSSNTYKLEKKNTFMVQ